MSDKPLMPKATAVWLNDNTSLTFEQIAEFVGMHPLEVKGIADEHVAKGSRASTLLPRANSPMTRSNRRKIRAEAQMAPAKYSAASRPRRRHATPVSNAG
jgi:hypothetical protein